MSTTRQARLFNGLKSSAMQTEIVSSLCVSRSLGDSINCSAPGGATMSGTLETVHGQGINAPGNKRQFDCHNIGAPAEALGDIFKPEDAINVEYWRGANDWYLTRLPTALATFEPAFVCNWPNLPSP